MGKEAAEEYEVEYINDHKIEEKKNKKRLLFEIKWKGYPASQNTWELSESTENAKELVDQYWAMKGGGVAARARCEKLLKSNKEESNKEESEEEEEDKPRRTRSAKNKSTPVVTPSVPSKRRKLLASKKVQVEKIEYTSDDENDEFSESEIEKENFRLKGNWKKDAVKVIEVRSVGKGDKKELFGVVRWSDGKLGLYKTSIITKNIPQKLIKYYENKLSFEEKA